MLGGPSADSDGGPMGLPLDLIPTRLGEIQSVRPTGRLPGTWIVQTARQRLVVKRMGNERPREPFSRLLGELHDSGSWPLPRLVDATDGDCCWFALFDHFEGLVGAVPSTETWRQASRLLDRLSETRPVERRCQLVPLWLDRLQKIDLGDPVADALLAGVVEQAPADAQTFAHGDFSPQNFCVAAGRLAVIDLEEAGSAPPGFDLGWLLALHRVGALRDFDEAGFRRTARAWAPPAVINWAAALGLLRLRYRCLTLPMPSEVRAWTSMRVALSLREFARTTRFDH